MNKSKITYFCDILMLCSILIILILSLIKTIVFPKDINKYENRSANKIKFVSINSFLSNDFQDSMELAFADQIILSTTMKRIYNYYSHTIIEKIYNNMEETCLKNKYVNLNGIYRIGGTDNLVYLPNEKATYLTNIVDKKINNINGTVQNHPELEFYVYYIEKDTDFNFETNEKSGISDYINEKLSNDVIFGRFEINSFNDFNEYFYKTDHHWNYKGSYKGYREVLKMFSNDEPLNPIDTITIGNRFSGSKASTSGTNEIYFEEFNAYIFDIPKHKTYINGVEREYGQEALYIANRNQDISYGSFYGWDSGEVEFDFNNQEKENILIIGESYDNAIIKLLASHFNKTYCIDLRDYENANGKKFHFGDYVKDKKIDKVLCIGNIGYFMEESFIWEE